MKVLVTGATGFVGSHLTERLVLEGYSVKALTREYSDVSLLKSLGVEIVYGDIRDVAALEKAVSGCEQVYHLAAATPWRGPSRQNYYTVNVIGTENLARAAIKARVNRLVHVSTAGVHGTIRIPPVYENSKTNPNSISHGTKLAGEKVVLSYYKREGLPVVIARLSSVLGPRALSWLGLFKSIAKGNFRIIGSGENHVHTGCVPDVVDALRRCADTMGVEGECYLIAGKEPIKVKEFLEMIAQELGVSASFVCLPAAPYRSLHILSTLIYRYFGFLPHSNRYELFLTDRILCISKAQKELGYNPQVPMREEIKQTVKWYREKGYI